MHTKFSKIVIGVLCIYFIISFIISCSTPDVMSQISKWKIYGLNIVPGIDKWHDTGEWMFGLETMGAFSVDYKDEYLRKDISFIHICFLNDSNDINIGIMINLSESDNAMMKLDVDYDYEEKKLVYDPVYILKGEPGNEEVYTDEKSIDEYLNQYGLIRQDVKKYQNYAIYGVIVRTWSSAHFESYWLENWKLKLCEVEDNTFRFEEE